MIPIEHLLVICNIPTTPTDGLPRRAAKLEKECNVKVLEDLIMPIEKFFFLVLLLPREIHEAPLA
jgi:hypothetical protein